MLFVPHSSSYISNVIVACVVNIVLAVAGTILNSFVLFKTVFFRHNSPLFNRYWSSNSCPSFVRVKIFDNVGFAKMSVHCGLCHSIIIILKDFRMFSFRYQHWKIFRNNSSIFASNLFHQAKVCFNLSLFLVPCRSLHSMLYLFYVFGSSYSNYSLYHGFHILVHVCTVAIYVVARNKVYSNSDQESRRNFMAFLR